MEVVEASMEVVEANMEVNGGKIRGRAIKVAVEVSMAAPMYFCESGLHGCVHGSSVSFQEQPEGCGSTL